MTHDLDDDDDGLPPHLQRLLKEGAEGPPLSAEASDRLLGRVLVTVGAATAATAAVAAATSAAPAASTTAAATAGTAATSAGGGAVAGLSIAVKAAVVAGVVAVAGVVGVVATRAPAPVVAPDPIVATSPLVPAPAVALPPPSVPVLTPVPVPASSVPVLTPVPVPSTSTKPKAQPLALTTPATWEVPALEAARAALGAGQTDEALRLVEDHARRAPHSPLGEEAAALRVIALSRAGRVDEADAAATAFLTSYPDSLFAARVRKAVAVE